MNCFHLIVSGKVQGVFFRANVKNKALDLGMKGYVKNLPDGNVEVVAQGEEIKVKELIDFIRNSPGISKVAGVEIRQKEPENFKNFEIIR